MRKALSVILCVIMMFSMAVPAFAAEKVVTIYIAGRGTADLLDAEGNLLTNQSNIDRVSYIKDAAPAVVDQLAIALMTGRYDGYIQSLVDAFAPIYEDTILDKNGEISDGSHIEWDYKTAPIVLTKDYGIPAYPFFYDWRISPIEIADQLNHYIDRVMRATGAKKVNIYSRCYGVNVAMTYVTKSLQGEYPFVLKHMVHDTPGLGGYLLVAGLLSGSIVFDADKIDRFVTYYLNGSELFDDPALEAFAAAMVSILNTAKVLGYGTEVIEDIYKNVCPELISRIALCSTYGRTLAYWAMMGEYYEEAMNTVFYTQELKDEYAGLIEKADEYYELLIKDNAYVDVLEALYDKGVRFAVFAKYGKVTFPLFEDSEITGDVRGTVIDASYGATAVEYGKTLSKDYIEAAKLNGTDKYISADLQIDASTCLFPDTTWFIKNIEHDNFPAKIAQLGKAFFDSDGTLTVWNSSLPQFMDYKTNYAEVEPDENFAWTNNPLKNLFRFLTAFIEFFGKYFDKLLIATN